jgi:hypothetical protein
VGIPDHALSFLWTNPKYKWTSIFFLSVQLTAILFLSSTLFLDSFLGFHAPEYYLEDDLFLKVVSRSPIAIVNKS